MARTSSYIKTDGYLTPNTPEFNPPLTFFGCDAQVSVLIDKERSRWIEDAIDNNFMPHEAKMIKSILISFTNVEDKLCWPSNVDRVYSIKAEYRLLLEEKLSSNVGTSNVSHSKNTWKGLWKLRIPNRTKTLWCTNLDAVPTQVNLVKRKVLIDSICQVCGIEQESTLHIFWSCPKLNEVWAMHFGSLRSEARDCLTFLEVFRMCMEKSLLICL